MPQWLESKSLHVVGMWLDINLCIMIASGKRHKRQVSVYRNASSLANGEARGGGGLIYRRNHDYQRYMYNMSFNAFQCHFIYSLPEIERNLTFY